MEGRMGQVGAGGKGGTVHRLVDLGNGSGASPFVGGYASERSGQPEESHSGSAVLWSRLAGRGGWSYLEQHGHQAAWMGHRRSGNLGSWRAEGKQTCMGTPVERDFRRVVNLLKHPASEEVGSTTEVK